MYHRFGPRSSGGITIEQFAAQLDEMKGHFTVLPLLEFCRQRREGRRSWGSACVITVDDGFRDFYNLAYPILHQKRLPATLFVVTDFVSHGGWLWWSIIRYLLDKTTVPRLSITLKDHVLNLGLSNNEERVAAWHALTNFCTLVTEPEKWMILQQLSETLGVPIPTHPPDKDEACTVSDLEEMASNGISFGPHSAHHPILVRCEPDQWKQEIMTSREELKALTRGYVDVFAYPSGTPGDYNEAITQFIEEVGFEGAVAAHYFDFESEGQFTLRRCNASSDFDDFLWALWGGEYVVIRAKEMLGKLFAKIGVSRCPRQ